MEIFLLNFNFFMLFIIAYRKIRHGLHILQLENYYNDRYLKWMKDNFKNIFKIKEIILLGIIVAISFIKLNLGLTLNLLVLITLNLMFRRKKEKKAFVVTSRVKRMYLTLLILFALTVYIGNSINIKYALIIINIVQIISYIFVYIVNIINKPVENAIKLKFNNNISITISLLYLSTIDYFKKMYFSYLLFIVFKKFI